MAFFSIIIPLYNKENFIGDTLKSVLSQTFRDFEIIVVNDGSIDNSEEKVLQFTDSRIRYFNKENGGVSSARNFGIEKASTNYISLLDADDYWYPDFLKTMHENIHRFPDQKVFTAAIEIETSKINFPADYSVEKTSDCEIVNYFTASMKESIICSSAAVFHKTIFEDTGVFDNKIKSGEDIDLWIRIGLRYPVVFCWKTLARYVYDPGSLSKKESYFNAKKNYSAYEEHAKSNPDLKRFLDLNRFSLAIKSKLSGDDIGFKELSQAIDPRNLVLRKRILLKLPSFSLKGLILLKAFLADIGLGSSVFK